MKKFLFKSIIFILPLMIIFSIPKCTNYIFNTEIKGKINSLIKNKNDRYIIICGDSRAERHIIADLVEEKFGIKTVNIGVSAGDLHILYNSLINYKINNPQNILLISASSWQLNINSLETWDIPHAKITQMPLLMQIKLYKVKVLTVYLDRLRKIFSEIFRIDSNTILYSDDLRIQTSGFHAVDGFMSEVYLDTVNIYTDEILSEWYGDSIENRMGTKVFRKSLDNISKLGNNAIFIKSPIAPSWKEKTLNTFIDTIENSHTRILKDFCSSTPNIQFIDFYSNQDLIFKDSLFYSSTHLNRNGAVVFTKSIIDSLLTKKLLN